MEWRSPFQPRAGGEFLRFVVGAIAALVYYLVSALLLWLSVYLLFWSWWYNIKHVLIAHPVLYSIKGRLSLFLAATNHHCHPHHPNPNTHSGQIEIQRRQVLQFWVLCTLQRSVDGTLILKDCWRIYCQERVSWILKVASFCFLGRPDRMHWTNEHNLVLVDCVVQARKGGRVVRRRHGIVEVQESEGEDSLKTQKRTGVFYSKTSSPSNTSMFPFFSSLYTRTACPHRLLSLHAAEFSPRPEYHPCSKTMTTRPTTRTRQKMRVLRRKRGIT